MYEFIQKCVMLNLYLTHDVELCIVFFIEWAHKQKKIDRRWANNWSKRWDVILRFGSTIHLHQTESCTFNLTTAECSQIRFLLLWQVTRGQCGASGVSHSKALDSFHFWRWWTEKSIVFFCSCPFLQGTNALNEMIPHMLNQMLLIKVTNRYSLCFDDLTLLPDKRCYYQSLNSMQYDDMRFAN